MEEISNAIQAAMIEFKKQYGEDATLEDGESFVTVFDNCVLIMSLENGEVNTHFIGGEPYRVNMSLSLYDDN